MNADWEIMTVSLHSPITNVDEFGLAIVYRRINTFSDWRLDGLRAALSTVLTGFNNMLVVGDFNINTLSRSALRQNLIELILEFDLHLLETNPTRLGPDSASTIDLMISPSNALPTITGQCPGMADHDILFACFPHIGFCTPQQLAFSYRDFSSINPEALERDCVTFDWSPIYSDPDLDNASEYLSQGLLSLFHLHVPIRSKTRRTLEDSVFNHPDVIRARQWAFQAQCQWRRTRTRADYIAFHNFRRRADYVLRSRLRIKFGKYFSGPINWRRCRILGIGRSQRSTAGPDKDEFANHLITSEAALVSDIGTNLGLPILTSNNGFSFIGCNEIEVAGVFDRLKSNSVGSDGIPLKFLKLVLPHLLPVFTQFFNRCLSAAHFPANWKKGLITPIPKKSSPTSLDDWRPITVLPVLAKAFEYIILDQISSWVSSRNLLSNFQSGFREGRSTSLALARVAYDLRRIVDRGNNALLILLDLKRAFDSVPCNVLIQKLNRNFDFDSSSCRLLYSFLTGRSRAVRDRNGLSAFHEVRLGVPQGSVLAPILFSLYINNISECLEGLDYHLYADDIQLYSSLPKHDPNAAIGRLNNYLSRVAHWSRCNGLIVNPIKSQALIISASHVPDDYVGSLSPLIINESCIPFTTSPVRNLGLLFDRGLTWGAHVRTQCAKVYRGLRTLYSISRFVPTHTRLSLVRALIIPHLFYANIVMFPLQQRLISLLNQALNACLRYVFKLRRFTHVSRFRHHILPCGLANWLNCEALNFIFRIIKRDCPNFLLDLVQTSPLMPNRFILPLASSSFGQQSIFNKGLALWNSLPTSLRNLLTLKQFKREVLNQYGVPV